MFLLGCRKSLQKLIWCVIFHCNTTHLFSNENRWVDIKTTPTQTVSHYHYFMPLSMFNLVYWRCKHIFLLFISQNDLTPRQFSIISYNRYYWYAIIVNQVNSCWKEKLLAATAHILSKLGITHCIDRCSKPLFGKNLRIKVLSHQKASDLKTTSL